jgi:DNA-directed RNA polymerase beta' subunit
MVYLNSKQVVTKLKLTQLALDLILKEVYKYFLRAIVNPGEMVGIIASQSIGEPATQMCVDGSEVITVYNKNRDECYHGPIGQWIDKLLEIKKDTNETLGDRFIVNNMEDEEFYIHGVDMRSEKMNVPNRIRQISRLPANGKMMRLTTRTGRTVCATMSHAFLRRLSRGMEKVSGDKLKVGDRIPIAYKLPLFDTELMSIKLNDRETVELDEVFGSFLGCYLSNGVIDGDKIQISKIPLKLAESIHNKFDGKITPYNEAFNETDVADYEMTNGSMVSFLRYECNSIMKDRKVPGFVFISSKQFIASVLRCYLDGDGNVAKDKHTIRCCSTSSQLIDDISLLLNYFHIVPYKFYQDNKSLYHLGIFTKYADSYLRHISSNYKYKLDDLQAMVDYNNREDCKSQMEFMDKIPKIGEHISNIARRLGLDKVSRAYIRWTNVESIGRRTLKKYILRYEDIQASTGINVEDELDILRQGYNCDVIWDKIVEIEEIPEDTTKLVYDLSIENSETFMLGSGILVHNTLNTFHYSGVSAKSQTTTGVPRLKELLTISKNLKTPSLNVFLKEPFANHMEFAKTVSNNITLCTIQDILSEIQMFYEIRDEEGNIILHNEEDREILETYEKFISPSDKEKFSCYDKCRWVIRMIFNKSKMNQRNISMFEIYMKILTDIVATTDTHECVYADDNADNLLFRIQIYTEQAKKDLTDNEQVNNNLYIKVKKLYKNLGKTSIKGLPNITGSYLDETKVYGLSEDGSYKKNVTKWNISTDGSNLADVINVLEVDGLKTVSNNINEIYELFGIEAARQALIEEFTSTLSATAYVNYRHICILADVMTKNGILLPIDIHGVKKSDIGPLARASFEETVDQLVKSSCFAEADKMSGVSANIMLGQVPPCGTGTVQLLFDERKMYIQTTEVEPENIRDDLEKVYEDYAEIEEEVERLKQVEGKCMNPKNYDFGFTPVVSSSIRKDILSSLLSLKK